MRFGFSAFIDIPYPIKQVNVSESCTVNHCLFKNCIGEFFEGGGIYYEALEGSLTVKNTIFKRCATKERGQAISSTIYNDNDGLNLDVVAIIECAPYFYEQARHTIRCNNGFDGKHINLTNNFGKTEPGMIITTEQKSTISYTCFDNCTASYYIVVSTYFSKTLIQYISMICCTSPQKLGILHLSNNSVVCFGTFKNNVGQYLITTLATVDMYSCCIDRVDKNSGSVNLHDFNCREYTIISPFYQTSGMTYSAEGVLFQTILAVCE